MAEQQGLPEQKVDESDDLKAARAELAEQKLEMDKLKFTANKNQIDLNKMREQQNQAYQQQVQQQAQQQQYQEPLDDVGRLSQRLDQMQQAQAAQNDHMGILRFKMANPTANETELLAIIHDPTNPINAVFDNTGAVDYNQTFALAQYYQDSQKLQTVEAKTAEATEADKANLESQKKMAIISGSGAVESEPMVDVSKMTAQEMYDQGLVEKNDDDPVRFDK